MQVKYSWTAAAIKHKILLRLVGGSHSARIHSNHRIHLNRGNNNNFIITPVSFSNPHKWLFSIQNALPYTASKTHYKTCDIYYLYPENYSSNAGDSSTFPWSNLTKCHFWVICTTKAQCTPDSEALWSSRGLVPQSHYFQLMHTCDINTINVIHSQYN